MRALLLILIASSALGQGRFDRFNQRTDQGRSTRGFEQSSYAFFEFAPASGAGMGTACACTTPTGAKGEALTFTRAGDATCSKQGLATTGIANGDLVVCTNNQPRVEYDSQGVLGLLVESSRTNSALRSQELDNAAWISVTTAGAVTVTADFAVAPDGTTTAERIQYTACPTASTSSSRGQTGMVGLGTSASGSFYVKGNGTSGNVGLALGAGAAYAGATCAYNSTTWTRCTLTSAVTTSELYIGCFNNAVVSPNPGDTGSGDILVWGGQAEAGAYVTSYIPTVGATVPRSAETASIALPASAPALNSTAASWNPPASYASGFYNAGRLQKDASNNILMTNNAASPAPLLCTYTVGGSAYQGASTGANINVSQANRVVCAYDGVNVIACTNGTCANTARSFTNYSAAVSFDIGGPSVQGDGITSRLCLDPDASRCR